MTIIANALIIVIVNKMMINMIETAVAVIAVIIVVMNIVINEILQ